MGVEKTPRKIHSFIISYRQRYFVLSEPGNTQVVFLTSGRVWRSVRKGKTSEVLCMGLTSESQVYLYDCSSPGHVVIYSH